MDRHFITLKLYLNVTYWNTEIYRSLCALCYLYILIFPIKFFAITNINFFLLIMLLTMGKKNLTIYFRSRSKIKMCGEARFFLTFNQQYTSLIWIDIVIHFLWIFNKLPPWTKPFRWRIYLSFRKNCKRFQAFLRKWEHRSSHFSPWFS